MSHDDRYCPSELPAQPDTGHLLAMVEALARGWRLEFETRVAVEVDVARVEALTQAQACAANGKARDREEPF